METSRASETEARQLTTLAMTNYGHFTTMRVESGRVRGLSLHLERLRRDCRAVFGTGLDADRVRAAVRDALVDAPDPVTVRVTVLDPGLRLERPGAEAHPQFLVTCRPAAVEPPPLRVCTRPHCREVPTVKHTGLFGALHERRLSQCAGFDDALFLDGRSAVSEGPTWNVGFFDGAGLVWPTADVLPGVTMALLRRHHTGAQRAELIDTARLGRMEAAFATNAAVGVRPIASIDGVTYDPEHPVLHTLRKEYESISPEPL
ncbi:aminotransferase [Streptomyces sp. WAC 06738]|uniref:aminotransferase class IV n=1 Tax=Streptomyces sp. WAC 06738 TaxID=2203210 RepID=UPI000F713FCA|nr:aminotransferase class IV [Streptomyces sp. WAC 06738]AZM50212.1 aminotransferase [Streptomyces sp. WAC 06738]